MNLPATQKDFTLEAKGLNTIPPESGVAHRMILEMKQEYFSFLSPILNNASYFSSTRSKMAVD
jgi:hypothetical protein